MSQQKFFGQPIFIELASLLHRRYYLKGEFGKSVSLKKFSEEDKEPLRQLLGMTTLGWSTKTSVSLASFEQALLESAVHWSLATFVSELSGPLKLKSEEMALEEKRFTLFLKQINQFHSLFQQNLTCSQLQSWFQGEAEGLTYFEQVGKALTQLPSEYLRLPVFSYKVTGDSHAFDVERPAGRLLIQILSTLITDENKCDGMSEVEEKNYVLKEFFLLRDDINNYVTIRGLIGFNKGHKSQMWYHACLEDCSWNVPLREVLKMDKIESLSKNPVLIVENSGVYSILIDYFPNIPIVCSSGQFSYSVWQLLRKLEKSNQTFLYVGDLDPEGLLMAQKLINAFPNNSQTLGMNVANFKKAQEKTAMSESRLKKLREVKEPILKEVGEEIIRTKSIALQEGFLQELIAEIESMIN